MAIVVRNEGAKVNSRINVTPMVDVMLVLLIIFMVITPLLHPGPEIQLAKTNHALDMSDADKDDALLIAINREGRVFLGNQEINPVDLNSRIQNGLAGRNDRTVFVRADARSHYWAVADVVDNVRSAGGSEVGLLTERKLQY